MSEATGRTYRTPPPWLFGITGIPYGVGGTFGAAVMPRLAKLSGIDLDSIGIYGTLLLIPPAVQFLYAPIVDVGFARRYWLILVSALGAAFFFAALQMHLPEHRTGFLAFAIAGQLISGLSGSCNGGLMATLLPDHVRGRASAALNVGNLSGGALSGAVAIWLLDADVDTTTVGLVLVAMMMLPALAILYVDEPPRRRRSIGEVFSSMFRDVGKVVASRTGITGILLCLSPVGTAALTNYFSGMGDEYHSSGREIGLLVGPITAAGSAVGALVGGFLCDRYNRRALYLLSGFLTALCGLVMMLSPRSPATFEVGVTVYALITGFCYAAFTATVLETIGKGGENASTQYALFVAAGNAAIAYVGFIDTRFSAAHGVEGVVGSDATLNIVGVVVLGVAFTAMGYFRSLRHTPDVPPAPAPAPNVPEARAIQRD